MTTHSRYLPALRGHRPGKRQKSAFIRRRLEQLGIACLALAIGMVSAGYAPSARAAERVLPDIGSADGSLVTQAHERKIAEQVMRNLRQEDLILDDPELNEYIQSLGHRLSSHLDGMDERFDFFILKDMQINAFALPAGFIGVHAGLFLTTQSEDELASVLAHEIAHVSQKHFSRTYEASKQQNVILAAAIIAALAVGREDSNAGSALIMGGMANTMANSLAFSREHEQEADRLGIDLLEKSGFNADAMPSFFSRMQQATRYNSGDVPEYLRTHPVTLNRISDSKDRASKLKPNHHKSSQEYALMWHKLAMLAGDHTNLQYNPPPVLHAGTQAYARALSLAQAGKYDQALKAIQQAIDETPNQPLMKTAKARIYQLAQKPEQATIIYRQLYALYPSQASITLGYGQALLDNKQAQQAKQVLRKALDDSTIHLPQLYRLLADTEMKLGHPAASHRYLSQYYFDIGNPYAAATQIEIALKQKQLSFYEKEELEARLNELHEHLQLLSKMPEP
jgi:predicted Zn-dependent protease